MNCKKRFLGLVLSMTTLVGTLALTTNASDSVKSAVGIVDASALRLREGPGTDTEILTTAYRNDYVVILESEGDWYKVSYGTSTGYVMAEYCEPVHYADYEGTYATSTLAEDIIAHSYTYLGTPYRYGGTSYSGIDCSGFTMYVFAEVGIKLPHGASSLLSYGTEGSRSDLQPGDLVFFQDYGYTASHVGIYIGGDQFIHASSSYYNGHCVVITSLSETYYNNHYLTARRH